MEDRNRDKSANNREFESLKKYFDELDWKDFSDYEKERFAKIKRNHESLVDMGINPVLPAFMKKKKTLVARCHADAKKGKLCSETSNTKPSNIMGASNCGFESEQVKGKACSETSNMKPTNKMGTSNRGFESEQAKGASKLSDPKCKEQKFPHMDWRSLPWGEGNIELIESDHINIDVFLRGVMKNAEGLNRMNPQHSNMPHKEGSPESDPRQRYPRRNVPQICYEEEDISSDDDDIYCDECGRPYSGSCPQHGPLVFVEDKKAAKGPAFARNSCPDYLSVCQSGIRGAGLGIWTDTDLLKGFVFGPYKGKIVKSRKEAEDSGYAWEIRRSGRILHFVDGLDTYISNWMRFVNCAVNEERQNLIAFQYRGQIYYRIYKDIRASTELLVWYGDEYGRELGIDWNEDRMLPEGGNQSQPKRNFAPSTSSKKQFDSSQKYPWQEKKIIMAQVLSKSTISCTAPSSLKVRQYSQIKEIRKGESLGFSTVTDLADKVATDKRAKMNCVVEESILDSSQKKHIADAKKVVAQSHACPHCDYKTAVSTHLQYHVDAVHEGKRPHKCEQCDYRATQASNLKSHVRAFHEGIKYNCQLCDYETSYANHLQTHINAVHERLKPFKCEHCDYEAAQLIHLKTHVNAVHERLKPYPCQRCDYRASQTTNLLRHVRAVHERLKPYSCQHCDYQAATAGNLRRHLKGMHGGTKDPEISEV